MKNDKKIGKGWAYLINSRKWHFFDNEGRSLCRGWSDMFLTDYEYGNDNSSSNCKACLKRLIKLREKCQSKNVNQ